METENQFLFVGGLFYWDNTNNELAYYKYEQDRAPTQVVARKSISFEIITDKYDIEFKDDIDLVDKIKFRKKFRRKIGLHEDKIILLQDIKDVALYTANAKCMTPEFISFLHKPETDRFFRSLIVYFQFFFQVWNELRTRREELEKKIPLPHVKNTACEDLSDMRSIVAKEYLSLLHALNAANKMNMQELDRKLAEQLIQFSTRVVWYALNKPLIVVIEHECDRLMRSCHFNKCKHRNAQFGKTIINYTKGEQSILRGRTDSRQKRLVSQSALAKELLYDAHDHRLLAIGQLTFPPDDERLQFFEKLYLLPEEDFEKEGVVVGILGMCRDNFDVMLKPKRKKIGAETMPPELNFNLNVPQYIRYSTDAIPTVYPSDPPRIESATRKSLLLHQKKLWIQHLQNTNLPDTSLRDFNMESCASLFV